MYIIITVVLVSYTHFTIVLFYTSLFKELGFRIYGYGIIIIHNHNMKGLAMNKSIPSQIHLTLFTQRKYVSVLHWVARFYYYGFLVNEGIGLILVIQIFHPSTLTV